VLAVKVAYRISHQFQIFGEVTDDQVKAVEIVSSESLIALTGYDHIVTKAAEYSFQTGTQFIVVVDDENPTFHQAPI
jgi:hypothetical protein